MNRAATRGQPTLGQIVRTFKAVSTPQIRVAGHDEFAWQRNYYEHIIRNSEDWKEVQHYIAENTARWKADLENPGRARFRSRPRAR